MDQISDLKLKIAELQDGHAGSQEVKKLEDKLRRSKKYQQFYDKQKNKKYRNCGCQADFIGQELGVLKDNDSSSYQG